MRKLISGIAAGALALSIAGPAFASGIGTVSGGSNATATSTFGVTWNITNDNMASLDNTVVAAGDSGSNLLSSTYDLNDSGITTGGGASTVIVDNAANSNDMTVSAETVGGPSSSIGLVDGGSNATSILVSGDTMNIANTNTVGNTNALVSGASTGSNAVTSGGALNNTTIGTGGTTAGAGLTNTFNVNVKSITRTVKMP